jgi:ABC-type amino acid transport system permease subunit
VTLTDWASFLFGDVDAIRRIAVCPNGLFISGLLVLSAALARTWTRHDLRMKPWLLAVPFAASFAACVLLTVSLLVWRPSAAGDVIRNLPALLALFWMTAPLAWL